MTAREPSAVEVIETVQREHSIECTGLGEVSCRGCRKRGWMPWSTYHRHVAEATDAALKAAGFVVATRDEIRAREGDAWDGALNEMHDLGWMHDGALADGFARNPYRELIDADVNRDHEEDKR